MTTNTFRPPKWTGDVNKRIACGYVINSATGAQCGKEAYVVVVFKGEQRKASIACMEHAAETWDVHLPYVSAMATCDHSKLPMLNEESRAIMNGRISNVGIRGVVARRTGMIEL